MRRLPLGRPVPVGLELKRIGVDVLGAFFELWAAFSFKEGAFLAEWTFCVLGRCLSFNRKICSSQRAKPVCIGRHLGELWFLGLNYLGPGMVEGVIEAEVAHFFEY